jgi:integrase
MATTEPIRDKNQARELAGYFLRRGELRNHVLIVLGINTALRISDLLKLTWDDVYDFGTGRVRQSIKIAEKKTGKTKIIMLNKRVAEALTVYKSAARPGAPLIISRKGENRAISRVQAYRIIRAAAEDLEFLTRVSCHSLRKTFGYLAWKAKVSPVVIMKIYNHSSFAVTERYLGVVQDDMNRCYETLAKCN